MSCSFCPNIKGGSTSEEDSQNELRQLEYNALEAVLHAFRAQGPLDLYKEVLLDHLKTCLFISSDDYIFKVDHVATDPALKHICNTLNPSYSCTNSNWLLERQNIFPADYRMHMNRLGTDVTNIFDPSRVSDENWKRMYHEYEAEKKHSLAKLLTLKKEPFTPELLREILVRTEQSTRIDCKTASASTQAYNNDMETTDSSTLVTKVTAETQTLNNQKSESPSTSTTEQKPEFTPEPMDQSGPENWMDSEPATSSSINASRSRTTSTSAVSNPSDIISTFIANLSSDKSVSFNKFMHTQIPFLKPQRRKTSCPPTLKARYSALRLSSQQPEIQVNHVSVERSQSLC